MLQYKLNRLLIKNLLEYRTPVSSPEFKENLAELYNNHPLCKRFNLKTSDKIYNCDKNSQIIKFLIDNYDSCAGYDLDILEKIKKKYYNDASDQEKFLKKHLYNYLFAFKSYFFRSKNVYQIYEFSNSYDFVKFLLSEFFKRNNLILKKLSIEILFICSIVQKLKKSADFFELQKRLISTYIKALRKQGELETRLEIIFSKIKNTLIFILFLTCLNGLLIFLYESAEFSSLQQWIIEGDFNFDGDLKVHTWWEIFLNTFEVSLFSSIILIFAILISIIIITYFSILIIRRSLKYVFIKVDEKSLYELLNNYELETFLKYENFFIIDLLTNFCLIENNFLVSILEENEIDIEEIKYISLANLRHCTIPIFAQIIEILESDRVNKKLKMFLALWAHNVDIREE